MDALAFENAVRAIIGDVVATATKSLNSAVTTAWGVDWDESYIARDLMQNFFDANRNELDAVQVEALKSTVFVRAPASFNLERLFYLGSEKGAEDIGQYGEGFKVAAACLLRDPGVTPIAISGTEAVALRVSTEPVPGTALRPVIYDFFRIDKAVDGTVLILLGCSTKLCVAMKTGLSHFFHEQNPLVGALRWRSYDGKFAIYASANKRGHVFYRNLKRAEIDDIPLILVLDKEYAAIEKKIKHDRDRNAFGDEIRRIFYNQFSRGGLKDVEKAQRVVVEAAKPGWLRGHPLLAELADTAFGYHNPSWSRTAAKEVFGDAYFARCSSTTASEQMDFDRLEQIWRDEGRKALPQYFSRFGVLNAKDCLAELRKKAIDEAKSRSVRTATHAEQKSLDVLAGVMQELAPEITNVFKKRRVTYTVAETDAVLGELIKGRSYRDVEVYFASKIFEADFAEALAVYLHEHSHIFGRDGERSFGDALTELIESLVRHRLLVDGYDGGWRVARDRVKAERRAARASNDAIGDWLRIVSADELRELALQLPRAVWRGIAGPATTPSPKAGPRPLPLGIAELRKRFIEVLSSRMG